MAFGFGYSEGKGLILKEIRNVDFEDIIKAIQKGGLLDEIKHPNRKKYPNQKILIVKINQYVYAVPYVEDKKRRVKFLKTIWPSRALTKKYLR